ncbi:MAG: prepilin-type N-terminal cleavage/methylation domain-containing protein [Deltaproteobacteria bacterium]|nr:prepilin-type N-terminal cleavage/methylation domain-containing protein [Deltaproteobacteria bacterium]
MRRPHAFSMVEVLVAAAIAAVVVTIAVQTSVSITSSIDQLRKQAPAQIDARLLNDFLLEQIQEAGGGGVRPWHAITVDDGCGATGNGLAACGGGDRLRVFFSDPLAAACTLTAKSASAFTSTAIDTDGVGGVDTCCPVANGMADGVVAMTDPTDAARVAFYHTGSAATGLGSCTLNILNSDAKIPGMEAVGAIPPLNAQITKGRIFVYQMLRNDGAACVAAAGATGCDLVRYEDADRNNAFIAAERSTIATRVFDFQVALGYDSNPANGVITEAGTTTDEWVGTVASDLKPTGGTGPTLRMARFGVATGAAMIGGPTRSVRMLNRAAGVTGDINADGVSDFWIEGVVGTAYLRNVFVFDQ